MFLPLKRSLRANQWPPADARSHKFRSARRDAAPASSDAHSDQSLASWLISIFTCAAASGFTNTRRRAVREIIHGRVGTAVTAERTAGVSAGEPSRRRRVSGERPALRHRADVAAHTRRATPLTLSSHRNPRMRSSARTSSRPSATRRARCKSCTTSSRRRSRGPGSRSSSRSC